MHGKGEAHESPRAAPAQLHHLRKLVQQGDAEAFANELNLDPRRTRQWFEQGFTHEGYGAEVIKALGTLVLGRIVTTTPTEKDTHMADPSPYPDSDTETGTPRWVKVFGIIFFAVVLLFLILLFTRGPHRGPGDHISSGGAHGHTPARSSY